MSERTAKNLPKKVEDLVESFKERGYPEGYAWALAWSLFCKHEKPGSPHCKQDSYLQNQGKKSHVFRVRAMVARHILEEM